MTNPATRISRANEGSRSLSINTARLREAFGMGYMSRRFAGPDQLARIGCVSRRLNAPKLTRDSHSEPGTPLITPTDNEFWTTEFQEGTLGESATNEDSIVDRLLRMDLDPMDNDKETLSRHTTAAPCPPAPYIDTGIFDYCLTHEHSNSSIDPGMIMDSSITGNTSTENSFASSEGLVSLDNLSIAGEMEVDNMLKGNDLGSSYNNRMALQVLSAPRPDAGSWTSRAANVSPKHGANRNRCTRKTRTHQHRKLPQPQSQNVAWSVTPDKLGSSIFNSTSEYAYSPRWNLGLGLTLDAIAEPSDMMDFNEVSLFDVDIGNCSKTDLLPEVATPCPRSRGSRSWKAYDSDITPQLEMLSLHNPGCQRRQEQHPVVSPSGTQLFAYTKDRADKTATNVGQSLDQRGFCGWSSETRTFEATGKISFSGERSRGSSRNRAQDRAIFSLLPPVEL